MNIEHDLHRILPLTQSAIKPGEFLVVEIKFPEAGSYLTYAEIDSPKLKYEEPGDAVLVTAGNHRYAFNPRDIFLHNTGLINIRGVMAPEDKHEIIQERKAQQEKERHFAEMLKDKELSGKS